jgi:hypothetical protein
MTTAATILMTYESTTLSELTQWLAEQRKAGADKILLRRRTDETMGHELVRQWPMEGEINAAEFASTILRTGHDEGRFFAGRSVYGVFSIAGRQPLGRYFFDVEGQESDAAFSVSAARETNLSSVTQQLMRHNESNARLAIGQTLDIVGHYKALLAARDRRVEELERKYTEVFLLHEKLLSMQHQRDMEKRALDLKEKNQDTLREKAGLLFPLVVEKLAPGAMPNAGASFFTNSLEAFMGSLTPEQITTIMSALGPEQGAFIGGLYTRFANKHGVKAENEPSTGNDNTKNPSGPAK